MVRKINDTKEIDEAFDKLDSAILEAHKRGKRNIVVSFLIGIVVGCAIMYISHKDIYHHYNVCQEQELIRKLAEKNDSWTVKDCKIVKEKK